MYEGQKVLVSQEMGHYCLDHMVDRLLNICIPASKYIEESVVTHGFRLSCSFLFFLGILLLVGGKFHPEVDLQLTLI